MACITQHEWQRSNQATHGTQPQHGEMERECLSRRFSLSFGDILSLADLGDLVGGLALLLLDRLDHRGHLVLVRGHFPAQSAWQVSQFVNRDASARPTTAHLLPQARHRSAPNRAALAGQGCWNKVACGRWAGVRNAPVHLEAKQLLVLVVDVRLAPLDVREVRRDEQSLRGWGGSATRRAQTKHARAPQPIPAIAANRAPLALRRKPKSTACVRPLVRNAGLGWAGGR